MPPSRTRPNHNTGDNIPYSFRTVSGFFNVPHYLISMKGCETGPTVYSPYPRRLESLTIPKRERTSKNSRCFTHGEHGGG